jgi:Apea-like HEPN
MTSGGLPCVEQFVSDVYRDSEPGYPDDLSGVSFSRPGEGSLFLSQRETAEYARVVSRLMDDFVKHEDMSRRSVERYLQDVLFAAFDIHSRTTVSFDDRLASGVAGLWRRLTQPASEYTIWVPVGGLAPEGLPRRFGKLRFVLMDETQLRRLSSPRGQGLTKADIASRHRALADLKGLPSWGEGTAVVTLQARDDDAAGELAQRETRRTLDVLNFFADIVPYNYGWLYVPGETAAVTRGAPVLRADGMLSIPFTREGPLHTFKLSSIEDTAFLKPSVRRVDRLMRSEIVPSMCSVILASIQWAGRASTEPTREQAFLLYAIALETLMLPEESRQGLTYRLRIRVAHLLGKNRSSRKEVSALVNHLYDVRSRIVHSGSYEVTDDDLGRLKSIVKQCLLRALMDRRVRRLESPEAFRQWFEDRVLS